jgi:hypothetical protein
VWTATRTAGASPNVTASAIESATRPNAAGGAWLRRERIPSKPSQPIAITISSIAQIGLPAST